MAAGSTIDLRSDTVTKPTEGMLTAMLAAPLGDDVYGEDPTVSALEERVAAEFGHEAALFCVTGSIANVLGIAALVGPGEEVLCDVQAHIVRAELGAHAALRGVTTRTFPSDRGRVASSAVSKIFSPNAGPYLVSTKAVAVENTHNFGGGTTQSFSVLEELAELCRAHHVGFHLDGARLWNAHVATGTGLAEFGRLFDTISVCFSKGLGAPVGSVLVSSAETIAQARIWRKRLGAGWRQAGLLAAAALYALDHHVERLADDHDAARLFAQAVAERAPGAVQPDQVETNIVGVDTEALPAASIAAAAGLRGVQVSALGPRTIRAVTHLDVTPEQCLSAGQLLGEIIADAAVR